MEQIRLETPITDTIPIVSRAPKRQGRSASLEPPSQRALPNIPSFAGNVCVIPSLSVATSTTEWVSLFKRKLVFCKQIFDTDYTGTPSPAQEQKHQQLVELCEFVSLHYLYIDETCYEPVFAMVHTHDSITLCSLQGMFFGRFPQGSTLSAKSLTLKRMNPSSRQTGQPSK